MTSGAKYLHDMLSIIIFSVLIILKQSKYQRFSYEIVCYNE